MLYAFCNTLIAGSNPSEVGVSLRKNRSEMILSLSLSKRRRRLAKFLGGQGLVWYWR